MALIARSLILFDPLEDTGAVMGEVVSAGDRAVQAVQLIPPSLDNEYS